MFVILPRSGPVMPVRPQLNPRHPFMQAQRKSVVLMPSYKDLCNQVVINTFEAYGRRLAIYGAPFPAVMPQGGYETYWPIAGGSISGAETLTFFTLVRSWSTIGGTIGGFVGIADTAQAAGSWLALNNTGAFTLVEMDGGGTTEVAATSNYQILSLGEWWAVAGTLINNSTASMIRARKLYAGAVVSESSTASKNRTDTVTAPYLHRRYYPSSFQKGIALFGFSARYTPGDQLTEWVMDPMSLLQEEPARRYFIPKGPGEARRWIFGGH